MERSTVLIMLTLFTLLSGMAVAAYQLWAAERALKTGERGPGGERPKGIRRS